MGGKDILKTSKKCFIFDCIWISYIFLLSAGMIMMRPPDLQTDGFSAFNQSALSLLIKRECVLDTEIGGHPLVISLADDLFMVSVLESRTLIATRLVAHLKEVRSTGISCHTTQNFLCQDDACVPAMVFVHTTRHRRQRLGQRAFGLDKEPVGFIDVLWWKFIHIEKKAWLPILLEMLRSAVSQLWAIPHTQLGQISDQEPL